jgi:hypothetical protein
LARWHGVGSSEVSRCPAPVCAGSEIVTIPRKA